MSQDYEFAQGLTYDIDKKVEDAYGKDVAEVWRNLKFFNTLIKGDGEGTIKGDCGDSVEIFIKVRDNVIEDISYWTDGCIATIVCGCVVCELALGKPLDEAGCISGEDVLKKLPSMPDSHKHCAYLVCSALHEAIGDFYRKK